MVPKLKDTAIVKVTSIVCLCVICCVALFKGIDSGLTATISAIIGGIAGYEVGRRRQLQ